MTTEKVVKMEQYGDTPLIELHKGLFQNGHIWRVLNTKKPAVYRLYFTMVSLAILSPDIRNKHAKAMFDKYTDKQHNIVCWLPYSQIKHRCNIGSYTTIKNAMDELKALNLIKDTEDDGVYSVGYISKRYEPSYRLHLHDVLDVGPKRTATPICSGSTTPTCSAECYTRV